MEWGMANRLAQLIPSDGRCLFLPVDHGYFQGPTRKLEEPRKTIEPLLPYADALFITRGVLRSSVDPDNTKPIILRVSIATALNASIWVLNPQAHIRLSIGGGILHISQGYHVYLLFLIFPLSFETS